MSPSALYLTWVSARSCPERRIGLMVGVRDGDVGGCAMQISNGESISPVALVLKWESEALGWFGG